jgi:hypothetical protein
MRLTRILLLFSLLALVVVPTALALRFTDDSFLLPTGETGKPYEHWFKGDGGCGPALPYQFRLLGSTLPEGLTLDKSGLLHGIPKVSGEYSFWVELSDENPPSASWCNPPKTAERIFTIKIIPGLNIRQNSLAPKATFSNKPYSFQLTADGGGDQTWSVQSGSLPTGLTLSSTGMLSGTPTAEGDFTFVIKVTAGTRSDAETYTLTVVPELRITSAKASVAEKGLQYHLPLAATGGRPGYTWSVASGSALPRRLTLDPTTGVISGDPDSAGSFQIRVSVTDSLGLSVTADIKLSVAAKLAIVKKALKALKIGVTSNLAIPTVGGVAPKRFTKVGGAIPAGIRLDAKTGKLTGKATKAGTYRFRVQVKDKLGAVSIAPFVLKVNA